MSNKTRPPLCETQVTERLRTKYSNGYAFFDHVRNSTGHARTVRTADALALGLWPSRGLELHGFEIKSHRSDLLRELKNPAKADEIARYCDYWWIVTGSPKVAKPGELPKPWGLMIPHGSGLKIAKPAELLEPQPLSRGLVAAIVRRLRETEDMRDLKVRAEERGRHQEEHSDLQSTRELKASLQRSQLSEKRLERRCEELQQALKAVAGSNAHSTIVQQAVRLVTTFRGWGGTAGQLDRLQGELRRSADALGPVLTLLQEAGLQP